MPRFPHGWLRGAAPELLAAASDNDPTNVGTAAAVGARSGYQLCWVTLLVAPLLAVVITIAAQVGMVTRDDLQSLTARRYGRPVAYVLLVSVVLVNLVTIAADLVAGAAGTGMLAGVDYRLLVLPLGAAITCLLIAGRYETVAAVLRYALLGFGAFGGAAVLARPDWRRVLESSLVPVLRPGTAAGALALLGTTLTSYVYIWETIGRGVEEGGTMSLARVRAGAVAGSVITAVVLWFMLVACAATLGREHMAVSSAQQAAQALRPLAGRAAGDLFAAGLVVSAVVALPVLMATTAYVVSAQFGWRRGLSEGVGRARGYYAVLAASAVLAQVTALTKLPVIAMLEAASILGGLGTPVSLVLLVRLARDPEVMGPQAISRWLAAAGWAVALIVGGLGVLFIAAAYGP